MTPYELRPAHPAGRWRTRSGRSPPRAAGSTRSRKTMAGILPPGSRREPVARAKSVTDAGGVSGVASRIRIGASSGAGVAEKGRGRPGAATGSAADVVSAADLLPAEGPRPSGVQKPRTSNPLQLAERIEPHRTPGEASRGDRATQDAGRTAPAWRRRCRQTGASSRSATCTVARPLCAYSSTCSGPTDRDEIVLLGDLIDNGPESRGVIEQNMRLGATARDFTARRNEGSLSHGGR